MVASQGRIHDNYQSDASNWAHTGLQVLLQGTEKSERVKCNGLNLHCNMMVIIGGHLLVLLVILARQMVPLNNSPDINISLPASQVGKRHCAK
ncbi:hypothetical protein JTB14_028696 [Gonioctena quinquepunctata]|nr:hypothetical protein JTB14_028696 [Gonioctena quinquepunctata]